MIEAPARIEAGNGSAAALRNGPDGATFEIRDGVGRLVFEYDAATGRGTLHLGAADLRLAAADGAVELSSTADLRLRSEGTVAIAGQRVLLESEKNRIEVNPRRIEVRSSVLRARVRRTSYRGRLIRARAEDVEVRWGRVQRVLGRVIEWATDVYQRVEGLWHARADRVRLEAERGLLMQAETADVTARGDVRVQGDSINLG